MSIPFAVDGGLLLAAAAVFGGAFIQSLTGFGFAMFAAPLLAVVAPHMVPIPILVLTLIFTAGLAWRERRGVDWRELCWILAGRMPMTVIAGAAVAFLAPGVISLVFALFVLAGVAVSLAGWKVAPTPMSLTIAGGLSGFFGTLTSIGAPPLALVYQNERGPKIRGTLACNIIVGSFVSLLALGSAGAMGPAEIYGTLVLVPFGVAGLAVSRHWIGFIDAGRLRPLLLAISALAAIFILFREILN
ncbi:sulfite exporter TauE/SafE family protein [Aureimonas altamirensis]|uniref:sulfite exporter TauE/SafE family protein n=1 Tax=Aureimonas altamirensis TaxID=370622 RepID=UPI0030164F71